MTPGLVSCIIPVFNGERYLDETIGSVLAQTYAPTEPIVVDDGSTDGTRNLVQVYGERVRYLHQTNAGHAAARNRGLVAATGKFVAFLDADDLWHREKLERQMTRFRARPELDVCVTYVSNFWSPDVGETDPASDDPDVTRPVPGYRSVTLLARMRAFDTVGPFDPALRHGNDTDWFLRAAECGIVMELLSDVLVHRRLHAENRSRRLAAASQREYLHIIKASLDRRRRGSDTVARPYAFPAGWRRQ
jgi:glycosyltransferase involved in cell wall biosynthesis